MVLLSSAWASIYCLLFGCSGSVSVRIRSESYGTACKLVLGQKVASEDATFQA